MTKNNESKIGVYMTVGLAVGTAVGVALGSIGMGTALGAVIGVLIGVLVTSRNKDKHQADMQSEDGNNENV